MTKYGLRIGSIGIEYPSREDRDKAVQTFTRGAATGITSSAGPRFTDVDNAFSTYERDSAVQYTNCDVCKGVFTTEVCSQRSVPYRYYDGRFRAEDSDKTEQKWLCDGCYAAWMQAKKVQDAQAVVAATQS